MITCDVAFAAYLATLAGIAGVDFYTQALQHVMLYREFLNEHGPSRLPPNGDLLAMKTAKRGRTKKKTVVIKKRTDFCGSSSSDIVPELCNEFVVLYCEDLRTSHPWVPEKRTLIRLTELMCGWMASADLTGCKVQRYQPSDESI